MYRRVLIITYYWPPAGGGGVQRWLKFAKYMPQCGIIPVVYTPSNPDYPIIDKSLAADIPPEVEMLYRPIAEPYRFYRKLSRRKKDALAAGFIAPKSERSLMQRFLGWVRGNYFIPDARVTWVKPSVAYLSDYLLFNPVDAVITTGPPHSMHLIGMELKQKMGVRWIADFRDQWVKMDNKENFSLSRRSERKHAALERRVICEADEVISVSYTSAAEYAQMRGSAVHTITNGYDEEDFAVRYARREDYYIVGHYGTFGADRDHAEMWERLEGLVKGGEKRLVLELVGPTDAGIVAKARALLGEERVWYREYVAHGEVLRLMMEASVLLLLINKNDSAPSRITGKIFEYLACEREIWTFGGEDGDWLIKLFDFITEPDFLKRNWLTKKMLFILYG